MSKFPNLTLRVLGGSGLPATRGGLEKPAEALVRYLVGRGWRVIVYCHRHGSDDVTADTTDGIEHVTIPIPPGCSGAKATRLFDRRAVRHAGQFHDLCLTLGSRAAVLTAWLRLKGVPNLIKLDGVESRRLKRGAWLGFNEWAACWLGDHLIADHPAVARNAQSRVSADKVSVIGHGAEPIVDPDMAPLEGLGLRRDGFLTLMSPAEPDDSVETIVRAFSARKRGLRLVVLSHPETPPHADDAKVRALAGEEVLFLGPVRDRPVVEALLFYGLATLQGKQAGASIDSWLVDALGAGCAVIAHDDVHNHWLAGDAACFFRTQDDLCAILDEAQHRPDLIKELRTASRKRFQDHFHWKRILASYEDLLERWLPAPWEVNTPPMVEQSSLETWRLDPTRALTDQSPRHE